MLLLIGVRTTKEVRIIFFISHTLAAKTVAAHAAAAPFAGTTKTVLAEAAAAALGIAHRSCTFATFWHILTAPLLLRLCPF